MLVHRIWSLGSIGISVIFHFFLVTGILWISSFIYLAFTDISGLFSLAFGSLDDVSRPVGLCADSIDIGL